MTQDEIFSLTDYLRKFDISGHKSDGSRLNLALECFDVTNKKLRSDVWDLKIQARQYLHDPKFYWPFGETKLGNLHILQNGTTLLTMDDWTEVPSSITWCVLGGVNIASLKGIERLTKLKHITLEAANASTVATGGLLRLLKCPSLDDIFINMTYVEQRTRAALRIINKHLKDKNIPECQQELIEEGFEEYAKL